MEKRINIKSVKNLKTLCAYVEQYGWSTSVPGADDSFEPYAFLPVLKSGKTPAGEKRRFMKLWGLGLVGELEQNDDESGRCCKILAPTKTTIRVKANDGSIREWNV
jgi:hypothetical protein